MCKSRRRGRNKENWRLRHQYGLDEVDDEFDDEVILDIPDVEDSGIEVPDRIDTGVLALSER